MLTVTSLFNNHKYSDAKLYLGQSKIPFPAHRLVLGTRSPYFDDALQSGFKEGITHKFNFENDSPYTLWRVLYYIYTGDYSDELYEDLASEGLPFFQFETCILIVTRRRSRVTSAHTSICSCGYVPNGGSNAGLLQEI